MQEKKSKKANVDRTSAVWRDAGILIAMLFLVLAFTWNQKEPELPSLTSNMIIQDDEDLADVTKEEKKPPPPPPPPVIEVVEDEVELPEVEEERDPFEELDEYEVNLDDEFDALEDKSDVVFQSVEVMPSPDPDMDAFRRWLAQNIKYPQVEREMGIEGKVYVKFVVEANGKLTNVKLMEGTADLNTEAMNEAALSAMRRAKPWNPGMQAGAAVRVQFVMPVEFKLSGN